MAISQRRNVALLIFDEVEVLDFAGPFEVFAVTDSLHDQAAFNVFTVAPQPGTVRARNGLKVVPDHPLETCPPADIVIIPGGFGTRPLLKQPLVLEWVRQRARRADCVLSVCTGSLVLAAAGLLDGLRVTTHHTMIETLRELAPGATVDPSARFHDNGKFVVTAGISAGIDAALHVVRRYCGDIVADATIRHMEYHG